MGKMRTLRNHAPELLEASKEALRYFLRQPPLTVASEEQERRVVMEKLRAVIEAADPPSDKIASVMLQMTPKSYEVLRGLVATDADLLFYVNEGARVTMQRVYLDLAINHGMLRKLKFALEHKPPSAQRSAFIRLAKQIEEEGLSKNPMEILAETGL
jgi:hypothetical protein